MHNIGRHLIDACTIDVERNEVARGPDAATLLDSTDTRNKVVDELMEVLVQLLSSFCPCNWST